MTTPIELNEFGMAVWRHKSDKNLFVERTYRWVDRIVVLNEAEGRRLIVDQGKFSAFDFSDWVPVTVEEFQNVVNYYKEIYSCEEEQKRPVVDFMRKSSYWWDGHQDGFRGESACAVSDDYDQQSEYFDGFRTGREDFRHVEEIAEKLGILDDPHALPKIMKMAFQMLWTSHLMGKSQHHLEPK